MSQWITLDEPFAVGDKKTLQFDLYYGQGDNRGSIATVTSVTVHGYDTERPIDGIVDAGSQTTLGDASVLQSYSDDELIGLPLYLYDSTGERYETEISDNDGTLGQLTFYTCGLTPAASDTYRIPGEPLLAQTAGTVAANRVSYQISANDMTASPGRRGFIFRCTLEDGDIEECVLNFRVERSHYERSQYM